ncbi:MAG: DNA polymerase III subunit epsilon, partial [Chloroflexi bacterium]|nr:DNA polymerase III subunit epsilon [Chloroflexota bacterium]
RLATFSSLVNPNLKLIEPIVALTGITQAQLDGAPQFQAVAAEVASFIGDCPIVGHRVSFDLAFLRSHGVRLSGPAYDTFELAAVVVPEGPEYGLAALAERHKVAHETPHRALSDALATQAVFVHLLERLKLLDSGVLGALVRLGGSQGWSVSGLARRILEKRTSIERRSLVGPLGIDERDLATRTRPQKNSRAISWVAPSAASVEQIFGPGGHLSQLMPGYEQRPQQIEMADVVKQAIDAGEHLIVEAGTGVGKSLAYLVPAALHALAGKGAVVISTNTINLQQQLIDKDIPAVRSVLAALGVQPDTLRVAQLKGRSNYLCLRRWAFAQGNPPPDLDAVRLLGKCLVWLQTTNSGDRAELGLDRRDGAGFTRVSAQGAASCPGVEGPCFLRRARTEAQSADLIIVNHALLLSDLAMGGGLIPPHAALVVDEAHHLEAVATRHLGFSIFQTQIESDLAALEGERGFVADAMRTAQIAAKSQTGIDALAPVMSAVMNDVPRARRAAAEFFEILGRQAAELLEVAGQSSDIRVTPQVRAQQRWTSIEIAWENFDLVLGRVGDGLRALSQGIARSTPESDEAVQAVQLNLAGAIESAEGTRANLRQSIAEPRPDMIYWLTYRTGDGTTNVNAAPLDVAPLLKEHLFARERCVILTSGTLISNGGFARVRRTLGIETGREVALGSPFDYTKAALISVPDDLPEPTAPGFNRAVAEAIREIALATRDRTLVLFTSNSSLLTARDLLREPLRGQGIKVVGQGPDGPPARIMRALGENQATVAMGAASLWEGVDLDGVPIKTLIVARLPFPVPTDPIHAARAELYEDSFGEYMVPEAVQRLRQGFGRLIRSKSDRGACVILDRRLVTKAYGVQFIKALPPCTVARSPWRHMGRTVSDWIRYGRA